MTTGKQLDANAHKAATATGLWTQNVTKALDRGLTTRRILPEKQKIREIGFVFPSFRGVVPSAGPDCESRAFTVVS